MPFLAQYSRRVTPLFANPSTILRISSLLRIQPFSTESSHANKMGSSDAYLTSRFWYLALSQSRRPRHFFGLLAGVIAKGPKIGLARLIWPHNFSRFATRLGLRRAGRP